jgi:Ca2+-binding EF-hand superfamily protein
MDIIGEPVTEQELNEMLALADIDKDGRINYEGIFFLESFILINSNILQNSLDCFLKAMARKGGTA